MTELNGKLESYRRLLDEALGAVLDERPPLRPLYQMMAYHLGRQDAGGNNGAPGGGKAVRPTLCFLACEAVGGTAEAAVPGALAVELLHNFTLVHDDIQDSSPVRRHRAAVWAVWGIPHAINVGDGLFALAHLALLDSGAEHGGKVLAEQTLSRTCVELCEGQYLDMSLPSDQEVGLDRYAVTVRKKTGALFGCAAEIGAILGGAGPEAIGRLGEFGRTMGEAFQAYDDVLGVWGDGQDTGKPAADLRDRKYGLPTVLAFERAGGADRARLATIYRSAAAVDDESVAWMLDLYDRLEVRAAAESFAHGRVRAARDRLADPMPAVRVGTMAQFPGLVLPPAFAA